MAQGRWRTDPEREETRTWSREEVDRFLAAAAGTRYQALWIVLLGTGMRCGEALGLRCSDIDGERNILRIAQVAMVTGGQVILRPSRSTAARRIIPVTPEVTQALREEQAHHDERRRVADPGWPARPRSGRR